MPTDKVKWPLTGGCHCGAVRYEIDENELNTGICNCRDCQRTSGAPFVAWLGVEPEKFRAVSGEITQYKSSRWARRGFCPSCGTTLTYTFTEGREEVNIATGTLDDPDAAPPSFQIFPTSAPLYVQHGVEKLPVKDVEAYFSGLRER